MRKFGILGYPLGHTLSPQIHERLFKLSGHDDSYEVYEVPPANLPEFAKGLKSFAGLNVTIPHKVSVLSYIDELDESAKRYHAVNLITGGDKLTGYNTDYYGFCKTAEILGADLSESVCVLGAGGAGRMFATHAAFCGAPVTIAVRESAIATALSLKQEICKQHPTARVRIVDILSLHTLGEEFNLLINATPVGMHPHQNETPVQQELLPHCRFVFDAIYNPEETLLLKMARKSGCKAIGGMAMLVWQAVRAHEIWDNSVYNTQDILKIICEMTDILTK